MSDKNDVTILDVTLRDGSYAIDYRYTAEQSAAIVSALFEAGIEYMELGHGCGLGAGENLGYRAAARDIEHVLAVRKAVPGAKIGVIAGPPPATLPGNIDEIIDHVNFIRFAANCDNPAAVEANLLHAKSRRPDLLIFFQMMRSTRRPPEALIESARYVESIGAKTVYIVDTAGHFIPEEVREIVSGLRSELSINVGFHGHNNLGLANANTIAAIDAGASFIDASLKGMGRAAGNAILEAIASILKRIGHAEKLNIDLLVKAGEELIAPIMPPRKGIAASDILSADANIDLYPEGTYRQLAESVGLDFTEFMRMLAADRRIVEAGKNEVNRVLLNNAHRLKPVAQEAPKKRFFFPKKGEASHRVVLALKSRHKALECPDDLIDRIISRFPETEFYVTQYNPHGIEHISVAEALFSYSITDEIFKSAVNLKWFHSVLIGVDHISLPGLKTGKVTVTAPRGVHSIPLAESAIGLMLTLTRKIHEGLQFQARKEWGNLQIMNNRSPESGELFGATVTIVGLGGIGLELARLCKCHGMRVLGVVPTSREAPDSVDSLFLISGLEQALKEADFVVIACPLTSSTRGLIDSGKLSVMKNTAFLVNISRGGIVDEMALEAALRSGRIGGAALDVLAEEPLPDGHHLYTVPNLVITPHIAGWSSSFWNRSVERFIENYERFLEKKPLVGIVDFEKGY